MSIGLLLLRIVVGLTVAAHGAQKLFGAFGGPGLGAGSQFLESLHFRPGRPHIWVVGVAELGGGILVALGLLTPFGAAAIVGVMVAAIVVVHWSNGFFASNRGIEFPLLVAASALALAFTGPGTASLDHALGWHLAGAGWGIAALVLALVASGVILGLRAARRSGYQVSDAGSASARA